MSAKDYNKLSDSEKRKEDWMNTKWRPMMGWMYMVVCFFDFVLAPVLWSLVQAYFKGGVSVQWQPLTLQGAGLFHLAMGAILGIAAYGRTQEKLNGANNGGLQLPSNIGTTYIPPGQTAQTGRMQQTAYGTGSFQSGPYDQGPTTTVTTSFGSGFGGQMISTTASGKKIVPEEPMPLI